MREAKCKLFPYKRKNFISIQEINKQKIGWNITAFDLPQAWRIAAGDGIKIAVLDTGVDLKHKDLIENLLPGKNFIEHNKPPIDKNSHGTHAAGIIVASNNNIGMVGVAPKAKVMPVKVLDDEGNGIMSNVAKGVYWAADNGANIISMSLGSPSPLQELRKAIIYAEKKGVVCFCAAGNAGNTKNVFFPAFYKETIAIGAIDENMKRAKFSNTGTNLDFMAPGNNIFSTVPENWYAVMSGTSMASPFAVGVAALVLSYIKKYKLDIKLNCAQDYRDLFKKYVSPIKDEHLNDRKFYEGFGIIDPKLFLEAVKSYSQRRIM